MKLKKNIATALFFSLMILFSGHIFSAEKDVEFTKSMLESYQVMSRVLMNLLVSDNYERVFRDARTINRHAEEIGKLKQGSAQLKPAVFVAYTVQLSEHVNHLKAVAQQIQEAKKQGKSHQYLRTEAARHFGGIVILCTACHEQFKEK